jgi:hypothetical protein
MHGTIVWGIARYIRDDASLRGVSPWFVTFLVFFFPGHNVFFAAYSESFYLAVTIIAFILHKQGRLGWASLMAGISSLVRTMGVFLALGLFLEQLFYCLRDRKFYWRPLIQASWGLVIVGLWNVAVKVFFGKTLVGEEAEWIGELLRVHVPPGANAKLWVLHYLAIGSPMDVAAFWMSMATIIYCGVKKRHAEMFYILVFYLSLAFFIYRPFAWSRYVSVLFPIQIMVADAVKGRPRLAAALLMMSVGASYYVQVALFEGRIGEP